ncbi:1-acyl-sn-glycerol-3-phosphate acyltransferase [Neisseria arctica]|uniref:1-acyl-sn-glycerol-3-phosphate acyltransferase n=1 Tax=Neisseria arctica TaxID=1470200 RepID=UPI00064A214F|nr:1-acyl-sn-glycerol-3-phosphate acyltransferase [Neisseria arctica]UOO85847.1 1-acyl-sn-glycerol-3-phosphate acyltransferase [Neisseria arctica]
MLFSYRHLVGKSVPRRNNPVTAFLGGLFLKVLGWKICGSLPDLPKAVVVAAPHTSNFDGVVALPALLALDLKGNLMAKASLFQPPFGKLMRWFGLIPVTRNAAGGLVVSAVNAFNNNSQLWLGIAPEGTRHNAEQWKTGFHRIALAAQVPIVPVAWNYADKTIVLGDPFMPGEDLQADLNRLYAFYQDKQPKHLQRLSQPLKSNR